MTSAKNYDIVYMTADISPAGKMAVYEALGWRPTGKVVVKLSTGDPPTSNYLRPELIKDVVGVVNGQPCSRLHETSRHDTMEAPLMSRQSERSS